MYFCFWREILMQFPPRHFIVAALAALLATMHLACASTPAQQVEQRVSTRSAGKVEMPPGSVVKDRPCGNPDWAQLPPGAEEKAEQPAPEAQ